MEMIKWYTGKPVEKIDNPEIKEIDLNTATIHILLILDDVNDAYCHEDLYKTIIKYKENPTFEIDNENINIGISNSRKEANLLISFRDIEDTFISNLNYIKEGIKLLMDYKK